MDFTRKLIANAPNRLNQAGIFRVSLDLFAQFAHEYIDAAVNGRPISTSDHFEYLFAGQNAAVSRNKGREQMEFATG
jgi:hypothetical protein